MTKLILLITMMIAAQSTLAIPIVNENVANSGVMTIYPDNINPHRYYVAPNVVTIAKKDSGVPLFAYDEYIQHSTIVGIMQMTLVAAYTRGELETAKAEILKKDPSAEFSGLPFIESSLELTGQLPELIEMNQCNHIGGLIGQEESCVILLTRQGRHLFYSALAQNKIFTTLQFQYSVQAVLRHADGTFADQLIKHGIAVVINGDQLSKFPQLISRYPTK